MASFEAINLRKIMKIQDKDTKRLIKAIDKYGCEYRFSTSHCIVTCPNGKVTLGTKFYHLDKQLSDLKRAGLDIDRLKSLM